MTLVICRNLKLISVLREGIFSAAYPCKNTTYCHPYHVIAYPGKYLLEVWGAEGSKVFQKDGGKGGYSRGILTLNHRVNMFIHIGGKGEFHLNETIRRPSNNGGGTSHFEDRKNENLTLWYGSGGGGTDIRLKYDDLQYRVIVAGGGGSAGAYDHLTGIDSFNSGILEVKDKLTLFVFVGQKGEKQGKNIFNGGGQGQYSGGGATDFRLVNGSWFDFQSLKSRIMVAAGGGGADSGEPGGHGGGLVGLSDPKGYSEGGQQTRGGKG